MRFQPSPQDTSGRKALWYGISFLLLLVLIELAAILALNSGKFVYTLDDPYIHLALAENLLQGHYGINPGELSAPSSSILWPFLLAPFTALPFGELAPLLLNLLSALFSVFFIWKILDHAIAADNLEHKHKLLFFLTIFLILGVNLVGLVFLGMEHTLQVLLVLMMVYYLIHEAETGSVSPWLGVAVLGAPLIRYENLAVSLAALIYLLLRRRFKLAFGLGAVLVFLLGGFAWFLVSMGFSPFPTSVIAKSTAIAHPGLLQSAIGNLFASLQNARGGLLAVGWLALIGYSLFPNHNPARRQLAFVLSLAVFLHLCFGNYGWYFRYEIYIWAVALLGLIYLGKDSLARWLDGANGRANTYRVVGLAWLALLVTCLNYVVSLGTIPIAANNIYEQHYQMHRFVTEFYPHSVAVNDIGYVTYQNDQMVLDLYGLANPEALQHRLSDPDPAWMDELAAARGVELAMVYDTWIAARPPGWIKLGELHLSKPKITPSSAVVSFYALNSSAAGEIKPLLEAFVPTLPPGVAFVFSPSP